jgi:hypothetical protein
MIAPISRTRISVIVAFLSLALVSLSTADGGALAAKTPRQ